MKTLSLLIALIALSFSVGCTAHRPVASHPLAGVRGQAEGISSTVSQAQSDGKEVRKSLTVAQDANQRAWEDSKAVKAYQGSFRGHLDRADYKIQKLLD